MRIHGRFNQFCVSLLSISLLRAAAFAQGRGASTATNGFYRFNYTMEEMQPIRYPAEPIATKHQITLHGETIEYTPVSGSCRFIMRRAASVKGTCSTSTIRRTE